MENKTPSLSSVNASEAINNQESVGSLLEEISKAIGEYKNKLKELSDSNELLKRAFDKYFPTSNIIDQFADFNAHVFNLAAVNSHEQIENLVNNINASPEKKPDLLEMKRALESLKERIQSITTKLSQNFESEEEAYNAVRNAYNEYVLKALESGQILK